MPTPSHPLLQAAAAAAWAPSQPKDDGSFEENALFKAFGFKRGAPNPPWKCPLCGHSGHGTSRLEAHSGTHLRVNGYKAMHEAQFAAKLAKKVKMDTTVTDPPGKAKVALVQQQQQRSLTDMLGMPKTYDPANLNTAVARLIIGRSEPANIVEDPLFIAAFQAAFDAGRFTTDTASHMLIGRTAMTALADTVALTEHTSLKHKLFGRACSEPSRVAVTATLTMDGRMSVRKQPLLVASLETRNGFLPLGAVNPGSECKNATYLKTSWPAF